MATEPRPDAPQTVDQDAFIADVIKSINEPPPGLTSQDVRDRLMADLLYRLMSAESLVSQVVDKIQSGGIGSLLGGLLGGKGK